LRSLLFRPALLKLSFAVLTAAQMLGLITYARASEPVESPKPPTAPPPANSVPAGRRALREFDRFLDHHPLLESRLRLDASLTGDRAFLDENPELAGFLRDNPTVADGLKIYPRYYLNRALIQQASAPLSLRELAPLRELFREEPGLERTLTENPELIRDQGFLASHSSLHECLVQHAVLSRVFLPRVNPSPQK